MPVLFTGTLTPRNLDRLTRLGQGWLPIMTAGPDDVRAGVQVLRGALVDAGRDPADFTISGTLRLRHADRVPGRSPRLAAAPELLASGSPTCRSPMPPESFVEAEQVLRDVWVEFQGLLEEAR